MPSRNPTGSGEGPTYRLTIQGELGADWGEWFGRDLSDAPALLPADGRTTLTVAVADQAQLLGLLRRIHDLNLTILSLQRLGAPTPAANEDLEHHFDQGRRT